MQNLKIEGREDKRLQEKSGNGWSTYEKLVLKSIADLADETKSLRNEMQCEINLLKGEINKIRLEMKLEIQTLKFRLEGKTLLVGLIGGAIPVAITLLIIFIGKII